MENKNNVLTYALIAVVVLLLAFAGFAIYKNGKDAELALAQEAMLKDQLSKQAEAVEQKNLKLEQAANELTSAKAELETVKAQVQDLKEQLEENEVEVPTDVPVEQPVLKGYVFDEIALNGNFQKLFRDDKVEKLLDTEISFADEDYRVEEQLLLTADFKPLTSVETDDEFGANVYVGTRVRGAIEYKYVFKDSVDFSLVTENEPLSVVILGKAFEIVDVDGNSFDYKEVKETAVVPGQSVSGVTVVNIGESSIVVTYKGLTYIVQEGETKKLGDLRVFVKGIFYEDVKDNRMAVIEVGDKIVKTAESGDAMVAFGEVDDNLDALYVWNIDFTGAEPFIGAKLNQHMDDFADDFKPLKAGESLSLPNKYLNIKFVGLSDVKYNKLVVEFDNVDVTGDDVEENVLVLESAVKNIIADNEDYSRLYVSGATVYVEDDNSATGYKVVTNFYVEQDDNGQIAILPTVGTLEIDGVLTFVNYAGEEFTDIRYDGKSRLNHDNDLRLYSGSVLYNVEANAEDNVLEFGLVSEETTVSLNIG